MRAFLAHAKQPVYTIIDIGKPRSKKEIAEINKALEEAGTSTRIHLEKAKGYRVWAIGHPYLQGSGHNPDPVFSNYLVVHPNKSVIQTDSIDGFVYKVQ